MMGIGASSESESALSALSALSLAVSVQSSAVSMVLRWETLSGSLSAMQRFVVLSALWTAAVMDCRMVIWSVTVSVVSAVWSARR